MIIGATSIVSYYIIENDSPYVMVRYVSNLLFVFFIPGFTINKYFFHNKEQNLDELTMGSLMLSILLISVVGIIFYYSVIGLNMNWIILVISIVIIIFSFLSLLNSYHNKIIKGDK